MRLVIRAGGRGSDGAASARVSARSQRVGMRRTAVVFTAVIAGLGGGSLAFQLSTSGAVAVPRAAAPAAGSIRTIAGAPASGGDGGPATDAQYSQAKGLAAGPGGTIVVDTGFHRVRIIAGGVVQRLAGTGVAGAAGDAGPALTAQFRNPSFRGSWVSEVEYCGTRLKTTNAQSFGQVHCRLPTARVDQHVRTRTGERFSHLAAKMAGGTRDQCDIPR